jgi:hypothetical protein
MFPGGSIYFSALLISCVMSKKKWNYIDRTGSHPLPAPPPEQYSVGRVSQRSIKLRVFGDSLYPNRGHQKGGAEPRERE